MNIQSISQELIKAVELIYNPSTSTIHRNEAQRMIEEFRDTSPSCAECGFYLSSPSYPSAIRHFGLRLVDHYIKLHWNSINCEEKLHIKNRVLEILSKDILITEENGVKDALTRIVVEIIKREWPQQWPSLLEELHSLCLMGDAQTELVLLIFLRLAEDIVQFQNVPDKRRREIYKSLCGHLKILFPFFLSTLKDQCNKYFAHKEKMQLDLMQNHCHVARVTLETLSVYMEWVPIVNIEEDQHMLKQLCHLLHDEALQVNAARCLLSFVERKGKAEDRKPILQLFNEMELFNIPSHRDQTLDEYHLFLKEFCKTLVTLGTTLCYLRGIFQDVKEPETFSLYLNCVLSLTKHQSVVVSDYSQSLWSCLLRDKNVSKSPTFQSIIPNLLKCEAETLFKVSYLLKPSHEVSQYSLIFYDSDENFENSFHKLRSEILEVLKLITKFQPELAFSYGSSMLKAIINKQQPVVLEQMADYYCLDLYSVWDAVSHYFDAVCISLMRNMTSPNVQCLSKEGVELLKMTLNFNSENLEVMSLALSCISALFFFANFSNDVLVPVFRKVFSNLINHTTSDPNVPLSKEVLNLRRHSSSLLIKLSSSQPKLLLPIFDHLCQCVKDILDTPEHLSALEKCSLLEFLLILSNELHDYEKQLKFLNQMLSPIMSVWLSDDIKLILSSVENFMRFVGLNETPNEIFKKNKGQLLFLTNVLKISAKRCRISTDFEVAEKGNFIHPISINLSTVLFKNPVAPLLVPTLPGIFHLIRIMNSLHEPAVQAQFHPEFTGVTDISETDKNIILGISATESNQQTKNENVERMKTYLQGIYDSCLLTIGDAAQNIMIDFYMIPDLHNYLKDCLFHGLPYLPDTKLRIILRTFLKPLFYRCPVHICGDFIDILTSFCTFMFEKLSNTWQKFKQKYGTCVGYEDQMTEGQEILEDQLTRLLTREYILFLGALLQSKPVLDSTDSQMDDDSKLNPPDSNQTKQLSEVGLKMFQNEALRNVITCTVFGGLQWLDTVANIHCLQVCHVLLQQLLAHNLIQHDHEAIYLLQNALCGLQEHGKHDSNQGLLLTLALQIYENVKPRFPVLSENLASTAGCDLKTVQHMEKILFRGGTQKPAVEKQKKDAFRNVVQNIIGKSIGEYYKREIVIKNLPPLFSVPKEEKSDIIESTPDSESVGLCNLFVPTS